MNDHWKKDFKRLGGVRVSSNGERYMYLQARDRRYRGFIALVDLDTLDNEIDNLYAQYEQFIAVVKDLLHQPQEY